MSITINNTTINTRLTIIFDADVHRDQAGNIVGNDGPASGSGNTESDVYIDDKVYLNVRSHTEVPSTTHALQCKNNGGTWTYILESTDNSENTSYASQSDLPQWVTNVVIRAEAEKTWQTTYDGHADANADDDSAAVTAANTARVNYLSANSITY